MLTDAATLGLTDMVMELLVAEAVVVQAKELVNTQLTTSPFCKAFEL